MGHYVIWIIVCDKEGRKRAFSVNTNWGLLLLKAHLCLWLVIEILS